MQRSTQRLRVLETCLIHITRFLQPLDDCDTNSVTLIAQQGFAIILLPAGYIALILKTTDRSQWLSPAPARTVELNFLYCVSSSPAGLLK